MVMKSGPKPLKSELKDLSTEWWDKDNSRSSTRRDTGFTRMITFSTVLSEKDLKKFPRKKMFVLI